MWSASLLFSLCLLFTASTTTSLACGAFETKITCQCTANYTMGVNNTAEIVLFNSIPSIEYCSVDCSSIKTKCENDCARSIRLMLNENSPDSVTESGRDKVCSIIEPNGTPITANEVIRVLASYRYEGSCPSGSGSLVLTGDLCCNRKCKCTVMGESVAAQSGAVVDQKNIHDINISYEHNAYECSKNELDQCQRQCLISLNSYLKQSNLENLDLTRRNLNLIVGDGDFKETSQQICRDLSANFPKDYKFQHPGTDIYLKLDDMLGTKLSKRMITLGRVCCQLECDCEWVIYQEGECMNCQKTTAVAEDTSIMTGGYECSNELELCMRKCASNAVKLAISISYDPNKPLHDHNLLSSRALGTYVCDILPNGGIIPPSASGSKNGYHIYVRHSNQKSMLYPQREDSYVGRLCCDNVNGNLVPRNNCE